MDPLVEIVFWLQRNHPNPMGFLGDGAKAIEVVLIVLVVAHLVSLGTEPSTGLAPSTRA